MGGELDVGDWLGGLPTAELQRLADALGAGRVAPSVSLAALRQARLPESWEAPLAAAGEQGWPAPLLAQAVGWALTERQRSEAAGVSLVSTHPGLTDGQLVGTAVALRQLFTQAERDVLIVGYRITERPLLELLRRPAARRLRIRVVADMDLAVDPFGRQRDTPAPRQGYPELWRDEFMADIWPHAMPPPELWYAPICLEPNGPGSSMHVKAAVADGATAVLGSANFTARGQERNFELGVLLRAPAAAAGVVAHFERLMAGVALELAPTVAD